MVLFSSFQKAAHEGQPLREAGKAIKALERLALTAATQQQM